MRLRPALLLLLLVGPTLLFTVLTTAEAQQPKKIPRIGYLTNDSVSVDLPRRNGFKQGLRDLGYIEGKDIAIDYRVGDGRSERLPELMGRAAPSQS